VAPSAQRPTAQTETPLAFSTSFVTRIENALKQIKRDVEAEGYTLESWAAWLAIAVMILALWAGVNLALDVYRRGRDAARAKGVVEAAPDPTAVASAEAAAALHQKLAAALEALSHHIDNERDRDQFQQISRRLAARMPERTDRSLSIGSTGGAAPVAAASLPSLAVIAEIENSLTRFIGPIAKGVVQRRLRNFETLPQLYQALSADIPNERDRAAFLDSLKSTREEGERLRKAFPWLDERRRRFRDR
jgi:hypothetical protein